LILRGCCIDRAVFSDGIDTLRDFLASTDVGGFIAGRILSGNRENGIYALATAKPTSLFELKCAAESVLGRRIYARYDPAPSNAAHNSYLPSVLPRNWQPMDISYGLRRIHAELLR
jgi:UDP-glucose 4-epimerase